MRRLPPVLVSLLLLSTLACAPLTTGERLGVISRMVETTPAAQATNTLAVSGDSHAKYLEPLEAWGEARGIQIEFVDWLHEDYGLFGLTGTSTATGGLIIVVDNTSPKNNQLLTLFHELTHVLHGSSLKDDQAVAEFVAESTAYEACRRIKLDTTRESMTYLIRRFPTVDRDRIYRLFGDQIEAWSKLLAEAAEGKWREKQ